MTLAIPTTDSVGKGRCLANLAAAVREAAACVMAQLDCAYYHLAVRYVSRPTMKSVVEFAVPCGNTVDAGGRVNGVWCAVHLGGNEFLVDVLYRHREGVENRQAVIQGGFGRHWKRAAARALALTRMPPLETISENSHERAGFGISWISIDDTACQKPEIYHPDIRLVLDNLCRFPEMNRIQPYTEMSKNALREHLSASIASFTSTLDPEAIPFVESFVEEDHEIGCQTFKRINKDKLRLLDRPRIWSGLDATFNEGAPLRRLMLRRPLHAEALTAAWSNSPHGIDGDYVDFFRDGLSAATGRDIGMAVARGLEACHDDLQRCCIELRRHEMRMEDGPRMLATVMADVLSDLPRDWIPLDEDEWLGLAKVAHPLHFALRHLATDLSPSAFVNAKGRWRETSDRLARPIDDFNGLTSSLEDVFDMVESFVRQSVKPMLATADGLPPDAANWNGKVKVIYNWSGRHGRTRNDDELSDAAYAMAKRLLLGGRSIGRILELSNEWHARQTRMDDDIEGISPQFVGLRRWKAGLPEWEADGIRITVLTTQSQLKDEGRHGVNTDGSEGLGHCVGGYASKCATSRTRIVSLRKRTATGSYVRLSTAEIQLRQSGEAVIIQHRGRKNAAAPEVADIVLGEYVVALSAGRLTIDLEAIRPIRNNAVGTISDAAGYEWHVPGNVEKAWAVWAPFLSRPARTWSAADVASFAKLSPTKDDKGLIS